MSGTPGSAGTPTDRAVSPDSGLHWSEPGAWPVADGVHRIPLPLPQDGLRAVNVYAVESDAGLTLVDGGWAIPEARALLEQALGSLGHRLRDVRRFLVTHVHRDHYTLASVLAREVGAEVSLGVGDRPTLDLLHGGRAAHTASVALLREAGAPDLAARWGRPRSSPTQDLDHWGYPDRWIEGDEEIDLGSRTLGAVATPGHTQGHVVFVERDQGLLLAGDHVLPTITPSIGFEPAPAPLPLGDFLASLTKVRGLPDLRLLPAHGPVATSSHDRVDVLLAHHEDRLARCLAEVRSAVVGGTTAHEVAGALPWTRHEKALTDLDVFDAGLATLETRAHLELLVARGDVTRTVADDVAGYAPTAATG